jgi:diacylglycerol kinase family enzyme
VHIDEIQPSASRRAAAVVSMAIIVVTLAVAVVRTIDRVGPALLVAALIVVFIGAIWMAVSRVRTTRAVAVAIIVAAGVAVAAIVIAGNPLLILLSLVVLAIAVALGRYALARDRRTLEQTTLVGEEVGPSRHGALIMNLKSGGGKAERFDLAEECRQRGIEAIILQPGDDLLALAHGAIDRGADVIGMAGGDGSQALVATIAAERGIPMVVVPAGTRNHLALDLGLDRDDVVGALDAFGEAVERPIDLGEVNGRVFVNNVSLGLYATIVQKPEYRDAKVSTVLGALPEALGPDGELLDLRFDDGAGHHHAGAHVIQVSNGPYGRSIRTIGSRLSLDWGLLGIMTLALTGEAAAPRFLGALAAGRPDRYPGYNSWTAASFEVDSGGAVPVGLDGESLELDPPLRFTIRPQALRIRLPRRAVGYSPAALALTLGEVLPDLWRVARGKAVSMATAPVDHAAGR